MTFWGGRAIQRGAAFLMSLVAVSSEAATSQGLASNSIVGAAP
jgi:hypothetical protein